MKYISSLVLLISSLIVLNSYQVFDVNANDNDTIDGEFQSSGYNNPTELTNFVFDTTPSATTIDDGSSLDPQSSYYFKLELLDYDGLKDIDSVQIVFYNNEHAFPEAPSTGTDGKYAVFEWNRNDVFTSPGSMALSQTDGALTISNTLSGISWEVINSTAPSIATDDNLTEAAFEVSFKISKIAEQGTNNWQFGYIIKDGLENLQAPYNTVSSSGIQESSSNPDGGIHTFDMAWYGEIEVPTTGISWTAINPGMDFDDPNSVQTTSAVNYISNGDYIEKAEVTEVWTVTNAALDNVGDVNLTESGIIDSSNPEQTFALRVITGTGIGGSFSPSGSETEFSPSTSGTDGYSDEIILSNETYLPDEAGENKIYVFQVKTSENLQNATYTGNIKFTISNQ